MRYSLARFFVMLGFLALSGAWGCQAEPPIGDTLALALAGKAGADQPRPFRPLWQAFRVFDWGAGQGGGPAMSFLKPDRYPDNQRALSVIWEGAQSIGHDGDEAEIRDKTSLSTEAQSDIGKGAISIATRQKGIGRRSYWEGHGTCSYENGGWIKGRVAERWEVGFKRQRRTWDSGSWSLGANLWAMDRAFSSATTREMQTLCSDPYVNPSFGLRAGRPYHALGLRSHAAALDVVRQKRKQEGVAMVYALTLKASWEERTSLEWTEANDPRPDHYKNLPSYQERRWGRHDPALHEKWGDPRMAFMDWDALIARNRANIDQDGRARSLYTMAGDRSRGLEWGFRVSREKNKGRHIVWGADLLAGGSSKAKDKRMVDLLGGDYYWDIDPIAFSAYPHDADRHRPDLSRAHDTILTGEPFGYSYGAHIMEIGHRCAAAYDRGGFHLSANGFVGAQMLFRAGAYAHGLYPDRSLGGSHLHAFGRFAINLNSSWTIMPNLALNATFSAGTEPPSFDDFFYAARITNDHTPLGPGSSLIAASMGITYSSFPFWAALSGTCRSDRHGSRSFQGLEGRAQEKVYYLLRDIGSSEKRILLKAGIMGKRYYRLSAWAYLDQALYTGRPHIMIVEEGDGPWQGKRDRIYWEGYRSSELPCAYMGAEARLLMTGGWSVAIVLERSGKSYSRLHPLRYTAAAVSGMEPGESHWDAMRRQEVWEGATIADLFIEKRSFKARGRKGRVQWGFKLKVTNIANRKDRVRIAYQQAARWSENGIDVPLDDKVSYFLGRGFAISCSLGW